MASHYPAPASAPGPDGRRRRLGDLLPGSRAGRRERLLVETQELAMVGGFEFDLATGKVVWSDQLYRIFGLDPATFRPSRDSYLALIHPEDRGRVQLAIEAAVTSGTAFRHEYRMEHPDGHTHFFHARGVVATDQAGRPARIVGICQDITEHERAESRAARRAEAQAAVAALGERALGTADIDLLFAEAVQTTAKVLEIEMAAVSQWVPDADEFVVSSEVGMGGAAGYRYRAGYGSLSGFTLLAGKPVVVHEWGREDRFEVPELITRVNAQSAATAIIQRREAPFGVLAALSGRQAVFGPDEINFLQAVANVLSAAIDRVEAEEEIRHRALHDPLTGLPNRVLFSDRLAQALAHAGRDGGRVAVLFCDLDQFKLVNDSLGHAAGDELLSAVAPRLTRTLRAGDSVARFGGDEFGILVESIETERDATRAAERVNAALSAPFVLRGREHFVTATIGIAVGGGGDAPETLIRDADLAMYRAKERGRGRYEIFDEVMRSRAVEHLKTENDLRRALERNEFVLHYQPVISLASGAIASVEALVRWAHPERGLVMPGDFVGLAEDSGLIAELGDRVLEIACAQAAAWHRARPDGPPVGISVNVSARQLTDPAFPARVRRFLRDSDLQPVCLSLEVTETTLVDDMDIPHGTFSRLKELGVGLVLDDFGTGFSSLGYLRRFPFDTLKIDRSFIERIGSEPADAAIVSGVTAIAGALGLGVVAEGLETEAQLETVRSLGCQFAQGYLFARPLPGDVLTELLLAPSPPWAHRLARA